MAPSRGKGRVGAAAVSDVAASFTGRRARKVQGATPDIYRDMLAEAAATGPATEPDRPLKRRRVMREVMKPDFGSAGDGGQPARRPEANDGPQTAPALQTIETSSEDEDDESDLGFEDVDLSGPVGSAPADAADDRIGDVSIAVDSAVTPKRPLQARRKPATAAERAHRLFVHQAHVLCLLGHCIYINSWCNNATVQRHLEPLLNEKTKTFLNPKSSTSQFDRNRLFMEGLRQASDAFRARFSVTASGLYRTQWPPTDSAADSFETEVMDLSDFIRAAKDLEGSQDTANQLFCALLRSTGVEARLVCSLQPLPFRAVATKSARQKTAKSIMFAIASNTDSERSELSADDDAVNASKGIGKVPSVRRRLGQPTFSTAVAPAPPRPKREKKPARKLSYPVFWVEAFNAAHQKWIPVDPIVTDTVNKPSKLEPPSSYELNQLTYAIALEDDGVAKDVTRRYAKAYNAKTRRQRVESTGDAGVRWWKKALRLFRRRGIQLDREQVEDAELAQKEAREGMPANVQDFKDHPVYALERHLRRHEVIYPKREIGKVNAGTAAKPRMEAIFRRSDLLACRSADKWYRLGRVIKEGEQPLKHIAASRSRRAPSATGDDDDEATERTTALYAQTQTDLYVPPPVSPSGRVPRNAFGNLDIYVSSMVPAGGAHIRHPFTAQAARLLHIDYADAVTGFQFKGRQGTAVIEGAVIAQQFAEAVRALIEGLEYEQEIERSRVRSLVALRMWKRFMTGLRIAERVAAYGEPSLNERGEENADEEGAEQRATSGESGFLFLRDEADPPLLTAGQFSVEDLSSASKKSARKKRPKQTESEEEEFADEEIETPSDYEMVTGEEEGGFLAEDAVEMASGRGKGGGFLRDDEVADADSGGGFLPDNSDQNAYEEGGFLPDGIGVNAAGDGGFFPDDTDANAGGDGDFSGADITERTAGEPADVNPQMHTPLDEIRGSGTQDLHEHPEFEIPSVSAEQKDFESTPVSPRGTLENPLHDALVADSSELAVNIRDDPEGSVTRAGGTVDIISNRLDDGASQTQEGEANEASVKNQGHRTDTESDRGSLLSHDPEDEDAEPDWLESD